jgi:hypothetical protein
MFDKIKELANKPSTKAKTKTSLNIPRTTAFVQEMANAGLRVTYAALADASQQLGEHTPSGLSAGQRGSSIVGHLPGNLQTAVCNSQGRYNKKTIEVWERTGVEAPEGLLQREYVRPEAISTFVTAFEQATADQDEPEASDEPIVDSEDTTEANG